MSRDVRPGGAAPTVRRAAPRAVWGDVALVFYYWRFPTYRARQAPLRAIVNEILVPVVRDSHVRAAADCQYTRKYTSAPTPASATALLLERVDEVRLFAASSPAGRAYLTARVAALVQSAIQYSGPFEYPAKDRACLHDCEWYRRSLTEVTAVTLDLHHGAASAEHLRLITSLHAFGGMRAFTRLALHDCLLDHSPSYAALGADAQERFWHAFHRWGPAPHLFPPGHLFENLLLVD
jgi:hypothetical protein